MATDEVPIRPVDRSRRPVRKTTLSEQQLPERIADPQAAIECMWQLAVDAWAMRGEDVREFRCQRHIVRVIRRGEQIPEAVSPEHSVTGDADR